jgi:hypothetical protein
VKALSRAHRWRRLLECGRYRSLRELAAEGVDRGYVGRLLRLTLLAPDIVGAVLGGALTPAAASRAQGTGAPFAWSEQRLLTRARHQG